MTTPVVVTRGVRESAVLIDSPHSGDIYPHDFGFRCNFEHLRQAEGMYIDSIFSFAPALGATLVQAAFPRSYIDVNRSASDRDFVVVPGVTYCADAPAQSRLGMGLVWRAVDGVPIYDRPLSLEEVEGRIANYWMPYHCALDEAWFRVIRRCGFGIHLTCLSMPSRSSAYPPEMGGEMPYDIVIGNRDGTTAGKLVTRCVVRLLERRGYYVGLNDPYKGIELVRKLGAPKERRHSLQIDINRRLFMDEQSLEPTAGLLDVQRDMAYLLGYLIDYSAELA
jgi:N-formylglutamate deformylase